MVLSAKPQLLAHRLEFVLMGDCSSDEKERS
jgi:hypothetical protein